MLSRRLNAANPPPPVGSRDEIADELADHLECSRKALEESGLSEGEAASASGERFGDVKKVGRELFWIKHGDQIMAQRFMWAALVVLFVSIGGLFWNQQRNTAELTAAIKSLTSQISKTAPYRETVKFRVTDLAGKPKAGFSFSVVASPDSPPVDFYSRELTTGPEGVVETPDMPEGDYRILKQSESDDYTVRVYGPQFRVRAQSPAARIEFEVPDLLPISLTFRMPKIKQWAGQPYLSLSGQKKFRGSNIAWSANCKDGEPCSLSIPESVDVRCSYEYLSQPKNELEDHIRFNPFEVVWTAERLPQNGREFALGPPRDESHLLTDDGILQPLAKGNIESP